MHEEYNFCFLITDEVNKTIIQFTGCTFIIILYSTIQIILFDGNRINYKCNAIGFKIIIE